MGIDLASFNYLGHLDSEVTWPGGNPSNGDTISFTAPTTTTISITDNDANFQDGTDDRDDEDSTQQAVVTDNQGNTIDSGQIQPRERIVLSDGLVTESLLWTDASKTICALFASSEGHPEIPAHLDGMQPARLLLHNRDAPAG